ncbi:tetratricopeptide repeat protein [Streptomyces sp. NPDC057909]|uniref:tetratricopeptide repeat protein n=1 Tax=Streptomyces sp. NPDC057909 TaxID=3346277 RepID=UPI0036E2824E
MTTDPLPRETSIEASGHRSVAASVIGTAITGDVIQFPAEVLNAARDVEAPPGTSNLAPDGLCLGREDELAWLRRALTGSRGTAITQAPTVHGLGGIGKSTLALHYAHRYRSDYVLIWWITADSPARIEQSLAGLALRLFPAWAGKASEQERTAWAMAWLQWHPGWLLIFDNVEDPRDLAPYSGALNGGHHLATSRRAAGWPRPTPTRALGAPPPDEAAKLLCVYALDSATPTARQLLDAHVLAAQLGYLPLALEQAGAYLHQNPTVSIDAYRRGLAAKLDKAADGIDAERTIARIWTQTFRTLIERNPLAVTVLCTLGWLAPDSIPLTLLHVPGTDPDDLAEALGTLSAYSMISIAPDGASVSVHRLVQAVLRHNATGRPPAGRREAEHALTRALQTSPKANAEAQREWDRLMPHLIALAVSSPPGNESDKARSLYITAAWHLDEQGHAMRAVPLYEAVLAWSEHFVGSSHPTTLGVQNKLAIAYRKAGDLAQAIPLCETVLSLRERILGDTHPDTLASRNELALSYQNAGDLERAILLFETALAQKERILGGTHVDSLTLRGNLAAAYLELGDYTRAIPLLESVLAQLEQVSGNTHPAMLTGRNNLSHAYLELGDYTRAIPLLESVLAQREQVLGETHPTTVTSRNNLAMAYQDAGDLERAIPLMEAVLAQREQDLADTHPDTLVTRNNLASAYLGAGDLERAIPLMEAVLAQCEQALGETHPQTLTARHNLAIAYQKLKDHTQAICLFETALAQQEQVLGNTHPATLSSRDGLAMAYLSAGDFERAVPLYETVLAQYEQVLGDTHPRTLTCRHNLAAAYFGEDDLERAIPLFETALAQHKRIFGDAHPRTKVIRGLLNSARKAESDLLK